MSVCTHIHKETITVMQLTPNQGQRPRAARWCNLCAQPVVHNQIFEVQQVPVQPAVVPPKDHGRVREGGRNFKFCSLTVKDFQERCFRA